MTYNRKPAYNPGYTPLLRGNGAGVASPADAAGARIGLPGRRRQVMIEAGPSGNGRG